MISLEIIRIKAENNFLKYAINFEKGVFYFIILVFVCDDDSDVYLMFVDDNNIDFLHKKKLTERLTKERSTECGTFNQSLITTTVGL